jgi:hypothetical protein
LGSGRTIFGHYLENDRFLSDDIIFVLRGIDSFFSPLCVLQLAGQVAVEFSTAIIEGVQALVGVLLVVFRWFLVLLLQIFGHSNRSLVLNTVMPQDEIVERGSAIDAIAVLRFGIDVQSSHRDVKYRVSCGPHLLIGDGAHLFG